MPNGLSVETQFIIKWCKEQTGVDENSFIRKLRRFLTEKEIYAITVILDSTCHECWNSDSGCPCWNDE